MLVVSDTLRFYLVMQLRLKSASANMLDADNWREERAMKWKVATTSILAAALMVGAVGLAVPSWAETSQVTEYEWSMDLDCAVCHQPEADSLASARGVKSDGEEPKGQTEPKRMSNEESDSAGLDEVSAYAIDHVNSFGMSCITCHSDETGLAKGHSKLNSGKQAKRLKKSAVTSEVCLECHKVKDLSEKSADYKGLTDTNGTTVNPHALPEGESHADIVCTDCHQVHSGKSIDESSMTTCNSCHHAGVFECGTCH